MLCPVLKPFELIALEVPCPCLYFYKNANVAVIYITTEYRLKTFKILQLSVFKKMFTYAFLFHIAFSFSADVFDSCSLPDICVVISLVVSFVCFSCVNSLNAVADLSHLNQNINPFYRWF